MSQAPLPLLREGLSLARGPVSEGTPTWTLYDPARHRFIRLGWRDFEILSRWELRSPEAIIGSLNQETTIEACEAEIAQLAEFARNAGLLRADGPADTARLARLREVQQMGAFHWLVHHYLFLRIRLVNPDRFLSATLPAVRWMFSRGWLIALEMIVLTGVFLVSRQWETYTHSLVEQFTPSGIFWMALALCVTKIFHELGHGYACKHFGCRVPSMGIAFLVLWPVLWTDTTDAWRLIDRRQRLVIDIAGMVAEITIAVLATLAWAVLPPGPLRSAAFVLSSTTWILTLLVNLSPLMRFDGYYILSDLLDFPNLQERGFAMARWWLRELLFRPRQPPPEPLPPRTRRIVICYAFAAWAYRFVLFVSIALLVYHFAFKALGIVLMAIELWYFVIGPILRELAAWIHLTAKFRPNLHTAATLAVVAALMALLVVPWRGRVDAPGILRAAQQAPVMVTEPGCVTWLAAPDTRIEAGKAVARLESTEIAHAVAVARAQLDAAQAELTARSVDGDRRRSQQAAAARRSEAVAAVARANERAAALELRAKTAGLICDVPPGLRVGDCLARAEPVGVIVDPTTALVEAYVGEADLDRVTVGATAHFTRAEKPELNLRVSSVAQTSTRSLDVPELASSHGGPIGVRSTKSGSLVPEHTVYRVTFDVATASDPVRSRSVGYVAIEAPAQSFASSIYRRAIAVLRREASL
jgi:putative peptide zinc metalloprotease protein